MNILMMSNTYTPIVGGLEKSVMFFAQEFRKKGHRVVIVAPKFEDMPEGEEDVIRIPAIQHFNGTDFSLQLPVPGALSEALGDFVPTIVHAHHPFLIGGTALRLAAQKRVPLVFTHHTLFEQYTHYVPIDSETMKRFVVELSTGFANLADQVFAPSESVAALLKERGVTTPVDVVPTGVYVDAFSRGNGAAVRQKFGVPPEAFGVGHVGRLAPEKNLDFLTEAIVRFLKNEPEAYFMVAGKGPSEEGIRQRFEKEGLGRRLLMAGVLKGSDLADFYHAMDVFAFASKSETQGMVLTEAMAAGTPVVAVDAPGVREVVKDGTNGRLLAHEDAAEFAEALRWFDRLSTDAQRKLDEAALATAEEFSMSHCADRALLLYQHVISKGYVERQSDDSLWDLAKRRLKTEWDLVKNFTKSAATAAIGRD